MRPKSTASRSQAATIPSGAARFRLLSQVFPTAPRPVLRRLSPLEERVYAWLSGEPADRPGPDERPDGQAARTRV
jgi:hypothetical protein